jgi:carbon-monoxide dehydrogenase medium subunit
VSINKFNTHIIPTRFEYHTPTTITDAVELLKKYENNKILAGGTDLIPKMKQRLLEPRHLINLKKIPELRGIEEKGDKIHIGALTKLREIERSKIIQKKLPLLHDCIRSIGSVQIRNMGTIGGNVCNASPAADGALGLIALDAITHIVGLNLEKEVKIDKLFMGPGHTILSPSELVSNFTVRIPEEGSGGCFISVGRTSLDISTISIAVQMTVKRSRIQVCRVALGSVAPTPLRLPDVEEHLTDRKVTNVLIETAAEMASDGIKPITDIRGTAEYRKQAAIGMAKEAITTAWEKAKEAER